MPSSYGCKLQRTITQRGTSKQKHRLGSPSLRTLLRVSIDGEFGGESGQMNSGFFKDGSLCVTGNKKPDFGAKGPRYL
jgi:hypothetical protein